MGIIITDGKGRRVPNDLKTLRQRLELQRALERGDTDIDDPHELLVTPDTFDEEILKAAKPLFVAVNAYLEAFPNENSTLGMAIPKVEPLKNADGTYTTQAIVTATIDRIKRIAADFKNDDDGGFHEGDFYSIWIDPEPESEGYDPNKDYRPYPPVTE
jgi:hypothetical protein